MSPIRFPLALTALMFTLSGVGHSPLMADEAHVSQEGSGQKAHPLDERYGPIVERLALKPEQFEPFKEALHAHREAQRHTMETHQMGRGKFKERRQAMEVNTQAFMGQLEGILTEPQMEIFQAWWAERKAEATG